MAVDSEPTFLPLPPHRSSSVRLAPGPGRRVQRWGRTWGALSSEGCTSPCWPLMWWVWSWRRCSENRPGQGVLFIGKSKLWIYTSYNTYYIIYLPISLVGFFKEHFMLPAVKFLAGRKFALLTKLVIVPVNMSINSHLPPPPSLTHNYVHIHTDNLNWSRSEAANSSSSWPSTSSTGSSTRVQHTSASLNP